MFEFFSTTGFRQYVRAARRILDGNWTGTYTKPSAGLYPHQWNWDSGFIAIGYAHFDQDRAMAEMRSLFQHQWPNGMIPQIVFNPAAMGHYFPEPDFWQVPDNRMTSGVTMPPLHATACLHIHEYAGHRDKALDFLRDMFPRLMNSHRYLYQYRDPDVTGLVYIRHPWESGLDNSPNWDAPLGGITVDKKKLPAYERRDLGHGVPSEQRPSDDDYDRYVFLVDLFRKASYDERQIYDECPFLVQDVLFNAILCRADRDLVEIGRLIGEDTSEAEAWLNATSKAISERMWSEERKQFDPIDLVAGKQLPTATAASFMPLFALAATEDQARSLYERLNSVSFCALHQGNCFTIPNYDMSREDFDPKNYWRGPVWININWMLSQGLKSYGFREKADAMNKDLIQLPLRFGFHEYFDSVTGEGYGSDAFSWTAALFIDLVEEYYDKDANGLKWYQWTQGRRLKDVRVLNQVNGDTPSPGPGLAPRLMRAMGELKNVFYDMTRGRVDYAAMKQSEPYSEYLKLAARLQAYDLNLLQSREEKLAFWVNLYNAIVVHGIVELAIESSVREVANFFTHICYDIDGSRFTPDDIEHGILRSNARPPYRVFSAFRERDTRKAYVLNHLDPRIHFALVCGSRSCAPIRQYEAVLIDEQLDTAARNFVNSSEVVILPEKNKVLLSQIFRWYEKDFNGRRGVLDFLLSYLDQDEKSAYLAEHLSSIGVEYLFYDWNLNH
ncbi:MAG: DUF547 domain-containing protein [Deltaproteobacteria bacterium]|nr:DUF547 domain-containing protein [Deltaproteobacteria bacterium]